MLSNENAIKYMNYFIHVTSAHYSTSGPWMHTTSVMGVSTQQHTTAHLGVKGLIKYMHLMSFFLAIDCTCIVIVDYYLLNQSSNHK